MRESAIVGGALPGARLVPVAALTGGLAQAAVRGHEHWQAGRRHLAQRRRPVATAGLTLVTIVVLSSIDLSD